METFVHCSIRLGVFLRRYPVARVFVIVYMVSSHLISSPASVPSASFQLLMLLLL